MQCSCIYDICLIAHEHMKFNCKYRYYNLYDMIYGKFQRSGFTILQCGFVSFRTAIFVVLHVYCAANTVFLLSSWVQPTLLQILLCSYTYLKFQQLKYQGLQYELLKLYSILFYFPLQMEIQQKIFFQEITQTIWTRHRLI